MLSSDSLSYEAVRIIRREQRPSVRTEKEDLTLSGAYALKLKESSSYPGGV